MSIAIVTSFIQIPLPESSNKGGAAGTPVVNDTSSELDFASILLGLPGKAVVAAPAGTAETAPSEAAAALAVPPLLIIPALNPHANPAGVVAAKMADTFTALPARNASGLASVASGLASDTPAQARVDGDERWASLPTAVSADGKAAKFAVADFAAQASPGQSLGQSEMKRPEQLLSVATNLATLAPANQSPSTATGLAQEAPLSIPTALRDPSWSTDLGQKLLWFAGNDKQQAQLTLNPPQLGSVEISLKIDRETASAHFVSANADVRAAIETALPRLREMFALAGIDLGQVSVGSESFRQPADSQRQPSGSPRPPADAAILGDDSASSFVGPSLATRGGSALVDTFA